MRLLLYILIAIALIYFTFCIDGVAESNDKVEINNHCNSNSEKVLTVERHYFEIGPFYYCGKGNRVYKVTTNKRVIWFRKGPFTDDIE